MSSHRRLLGALQFVVLLALLVRPHASKKTVQTRIVGGQMDASEAATYQISLQALVNQRPDSNATSKYYHFCSGSILTVRHVVTAAHCLAGWRSEQLTVVAGTKVWNRADGVRHLVAGFEVHDKYEKLNGHDIGMITLKEPLKFGARISSIPFDDSFVGAGVDVVLTGWGYTLPIRDPGILPHWIHAYLKSYPKELQITRLTTITNAECRRSFGTMRLETELCTYKWGTGACAVSAGGQWQFGDAVNKWMIIT